MAKAQKPTPSNAQTSFETKKVVYINVSHKKGFKQNLRQAKFKQLEQSTGAYM